MRTALVLVLLLPLTGLGWILWLIYRPSGVGSPEDARLWRARFESVPDPETAQSKYPGVDVKNYDNGEWVFGVCTDSHTSMWGGTVVVKDSRGQTRAFFGHVCGNKYLEWRLRDTKSLDDFYGSETWKMHGFTEYRYP
jgi:hypothetical protein